MNYANLYVNFLKRYLQPKRAMRVVFDCSNGTTGLVIKKLFNIEISDVRPAKAGFADAKNHQFLGHRMSVEAILINDKPDGNFPAHGPDPTKRNAFSDLRLAVRRYGADLGVIFDADGDRVFFVDNETRPVNADVAAVLIGDCFRGPVVLTELSGYLAQEVIGAKKKIFYSRVGHYFIKKLMRRREADFGAEASGHYYFAFDEKFLGGSKRKRGKVYFDSGIVAALRMINAVSKMDSSLSKWIDGLPKYFRSGEINFSTAKNVAELLEKIEKIYRKSAAKVSRLDGLKMEFNPAKRGAAWWFNLRPSGTEPLVRLNLEAKDRGTLLAKTRELTAIIEN